MSDNLVLEAKSVSKFFGTITALQNVDLHVNKGEVLGVVGDNGAGKSTLVKILYGLLKSDEGEITFNNSPLNVQSPSEARKNKIGMVFQHFSLFDSLTVRENLVLGIDQNMSFSSLQEKVNEISNKYK